VTTSPQPGKNIWKAAITNGRNASKAAREALRRLIEEAPGPQTQAMLIAKAALHLGTVDESFNELNEIGKNAKNFEK
jgi:predicted Zn-dependent protease